MENDQRFLRTIDAYEEVVARVLAVLVCLVIAAASLQLIGSVGPRVLNPSTDWLDGQLMQLLDRLLLILIALEVLQNLTAYLREHVVQIELVLLTALTAVARKVIVMPQDSEGQPWLLASLGFTVLTLAGAYWLVRWALRQQQSQGLQ